MSEHPLSYPEAPELRPGDRVAAPDFAVIGAMKSGTTRLWRLFRTHPEFHVDPRWDQLLPGGRSPVRTVKERMFLMETHEVFGAEQVEQYRRWFARPPGSFCGDFTPYYLSAFWVPLQFKHAAPDAKLVAILRDPIERFMSGMSQAGSNDPFRVQDHFELGLYRQQLARWEKHFPRDRLLVLQYESFNREPAAWLARIFEFLGMDPSHRPDPELLQRRINAGGPKAEIPQHGLESLASGFREDTEALFRDFPELEPELWGDWWR